jgi:predicted phosphodiesterase
MKVAVLSDVHGNAAALEAVLADVSAAAPDRVLLNGDLLALGPEPERTVELLRGLDAPSTRGNTDRWLAEAARAGQSPGAPEEVQESLRWTVSQLDPADVRAFTDLPFALVAEPLPVQLYHASAAGDEQGVWPDTPEGEIPALFAGAPGGRTFVVGHTHIAGERASDGLRVLNAGSVGFPFDGDTRACYLMLEGEPGGEPRATWRRVAYDRPRTIAAIRKREVPMATRLVMRIQSGEF